MKVSTEKHDRYAIVRLEGNLDGQTAPSMQEKILSLIETHKNILMDVSQVEYMSSAGLRVMLLLYRQAKAHDGKAVLVGLSESIKETMEITGFLNFFTLSDTEEEGLKIVNT